MLGETRSSLAQACEEVPGAELFAGHRINQESRQIASRQSQNVVMGHTNLQLLFTNGENAVYEMRVQPTSLFRGVNEQIWKFVRTTRITKANTSEKSQNACSSFSGEHGPDHLVCEQWWGQSVRV